MFFRKAKLIAEQERLIDTLKLTINSLEEDIEKLKAQLKVEVLNNTNILKNQRRLQSKIVDLENNLELLRNTYMPEKLPTKKTTTKRKTTKKETTSKNTTSKK